MKALTTSLVLFASFNVSVAQKKLNLDDPKVQDAIIAEAIDVKKLQKRNRKGEELAFAPNQQTPYSGWEKVMRDNGQIQRLRQFSDGKLDGTWTQWWDGGQKSLESAFKNGKRHGTFTHWYKNEQKHSKSTYKDGKPEGLTTTWYSNGQKRKEYTYKGGKRMTVVAWKINGKKCLDTSVVNGNGVVVNYNDDGTEKSRVTYKDGKPFFD